MNQRRLERFVDLRSKPRNMRFNDTGLGLKTKAPNALQNHRAQDDPALVAQQNFQEHALSGQKIDRLVATRYDAIGDIHFEITRRKFFALALERCAPS